MTGYGLIAVIPAIKQYKNAVAYYNSLVEHQEGIAAAVRMYNYGKMENYYEQHLVDEKQNEPAPGLLIAPMLRVGNLVGKLFRCQASVVMTNTSDKTIEIARGMIVESVVLDSPVKVYGIETTWAMDAKKVDVAQSINKSFLLKPGETTEIMIPGGITSLADKDGNIITGKLRQMICEAAEKKVITSCPKISIENGMRADIMYNWIYKDENEEIKKPCYMVGLPGVLRYCGEAFFPEKVK